MSSVLEIMLKEKELWSVDIDRSSVIAEYSQPKKTKSTSRKMTKEEYIKEIEKAAEKLKPYLSVYTELVFEKPKNQHRTTILEDGMIEYAEGSGLKGTPWFVVCYNLRLLNIVNEIHAHRLRFIDTSKPEYVEIIYNLSTRLAPYECKSIGSKLKRIAEKNSIQNFIYSVSKFSSVDFEKPYPGIHFWPSRNSEVLVGLPLNISALTVLQYLEGMLQSFDLATGKFKVKKVNSFSVYETHWE